MYINDCPANGVNENWTMLFKLFFLLNFARKTFIVILFDLKYSMILLTWHRCRISRLMHKIVLHRSTSIIYRKFYRNLASTICVQEFSEQRFFCVYFIMCGLIAQWPSKFNASIHRLIGDIFLLQNVLLNGLWYDGICSHLSICIF